MCLIVDANLASLVFSENFHEDFRPIIDWLSHKDGNLVVGGRLVTELDKVAGAKRFVRSLLQAGRARHIPDTAIDEEKKEITNLYKSDDLQVIALARISGARILCSHDKTLHEDFANQRLISNPLGHIYQNKEHTHLLKRYGHTKACRISMGKEKRV